MKAYQVEPEPQPEPFKHVALVLVSQGEVDAVYAMLNHPAVTRAVELSSEGVLSLRPFCSPANHRLYDNLCDILQ